MMMTAMTVMTVTDDGDDGGDDINNKDYDDDQIVY